MSYAADGELPLVHAHEILERLCRNQRKEIELLRGRLHAELVKHSPVSGGGKTLCGRCREAWPNLQEAWACHEMHDLQVPPEPLSTGGDSKEK